ncbi:hypothetical protein CPB86DRAFT_90000 [Serendipita vermifera]|nr:hypothetical protein CPB86DRAFT_90000 [Serendipita vermifera]
MTLNITRSSNALPTDSEMKRLQHFIESRERSLEILKTELKDHETQFDLSENAIYNLQNTIRTAETTIELHQKKVKTLELVQKSFKAIYWYTFSQRNEKETQGLCKEVARVAKETYNENISRTDNELSMVKSEINALTAHLGRLEDEMGGWMSSRELARESIQQLKPSLQGLTEVLKNARDFLSARRKVPKEIWASIFKLCLTEEVEAYVQQPNPTSLTVPVAISHVCKLWRTIVFEETKLWEFIPALPNSPLSLWPYGPLQSGNALSKETRMNFLLCLSNSSSSPLMSMEQSIPPARTVSKTKAKQTLQIVTHNDVYNHGLKDSSIPLSRIDHLKLNNHSTGDQTPVSALFKGFTRVRHLEIEDKGSQIISHLSTLGGRLPSMKYFKLKLDDMPSIDLRDMLSVDLVELRIIHNGHSTINRSPSSLQLPHLKTLGVVYPEVAFLQNLDVPSLEKLELYGSENSSSASGEVSKIQKVLDKIQHVAFYDWKAREVEAVDSEGNVVKNLVGCPAAALKTMVTATVALASVRFVDCTMTGKPLVDIFGARSEQNGSSSLPHLQKMDFIGCSGITRSEFEELSGFFPNLTFS